MRPSSSLVWLAVMALTFGGIYTAALTTGDNGRPEIDLDALLAAIATPPCIKNCMADLIGELRVMLRFEDIYDNIDLMCHALESSTSCVVLEPCSHGEIYRTATSGLRALCAKNMTQFLYNNADCLQEQLDRSAQTCDNGCHLVQTLADFSRTVPRHGGINTFFATAAPSCSAIRCILPCVRDDLNVACGHNVGTVILDALLKPLNALADYLKIAPLAVTRFVRAKVPSACVALTRPPVLSAMMRSAHRSNF